MSKPRLLLVGATGIIGSAVDKLLTPRYEIIRASLDEGDLQFDLSDPNALMEALREVGPLDHIISTAGRAEFIPLEQIEVTSLEQSPYYLGIIDKLMGQVNLALAARTLLPPRGSITLTSGTTSDEPIIGGSALSMVNGALEKWVMAAATEMPNGIRLNVVSPSLAAETPEPGLSAFPGFEPIPAHKMALAYQRSVESLITGVTLKI